MAKLHIHASVWDVEWVVSACAALKVANSQHELAVHLALDTGLAREGCLSQQALPIAHAVVAGAKAGVRIRVAGVSTHFCCPSDKEATEEDWREVQQVHSNVASMMMLAAPQHARPILHAASGAPAALFPHTQADMVRIGGLIFGILPPARGVKEALAAAGAMPARALRWLTTVVSVKQLPFNSCVGYECAGRSGSGPVVMLPLGSHDGFLEPSAGFRHVVIGGQVCPVLAVDANVVVVAAWSGVKVGDTVVILGCDGVHKDVCSMPTLSTRIPPHLPRYYL